MPCLKHYMNKSVKSKMEFDRFSFCMDWKSEVSSQNETFSYKNRKNSKKKSKIKFQFRFARHNSCKIYSQWTPNFTVVHITDRPTDRRQCVCDGWWRCRITINMMRVRLSVLVDFQMKKGSTVAYSVGLHTAYNSRIRMAFTCAVSYRLVLSLF